MLKEQTGMLALGLVLSAVIALRIGRTMALLQRTAYPDVRAQEVK